MTDDATTLKADKPAVLFLCVHNAGKSQMALGLFTALAGDRAADVVITMGWGDTCPYYPGTRYEEWNFNAPPGDSIENVRPVRDAIEAKVRALLAGLGVEVEPDALTR